MTCIGFSSFYTDCTKNHEAEKIYFSHCLAETFYSFKFQWNEIIEIYVAMRLKTDMLTCYGWSHSCHSQSRWVFVGWNGQRCCEDERWERGRKKVLLRLILLTASLLIQRSTGAHRNGQLRRIEAALRGNPRRFQETAATLYFFVRRQGPIRRRQKQCTRNNS